MHTLPATAAAATSASRHWLQWYYAWPQSMVRVRTGGVRRRRQKSKTEDVRECHYILPTSTTTYQSKQPLSALAPPRPPPSPRSHAAVSTANNGLTSYQQTIEAMSEEKRRRRRQPQQPLKQPRPASNWFEAVL